MDKGARQHSSSSSFPLVTESEKREEALPNAEQNGHADHTMARRTLLRTGMGLAVVAAGVGTWCLREGRTQTVSAKNDKNTTDNVVLQWNDALLQAIATSGPLGPIFAICLGTIYFT